MINNCRFCNSSNVMADIKTSKIDSSNFRYTHYVRCKNCHARGPAIKADSLSSKDKQKAIAAWNSNI